MLCLVAVSTPKECSLACLARAVLTDKAGVEGQQKQVCVCLCKTLWELQETSWGEGQFLYKKLLADGGQLTPGVLSLGFLWPLSYPQLIGCSKIQATSIKQFGTEMLQGKLQLWQKNPTTTHQHDIWEVMNPSGFLPLYFGSHPPLLWESSCLLCKYVED